MSSVDFDAMRAVPVVDRPFAHMVVPGFVRPAALEAVVAGLPVFTKGGSFPTGALKLGDAARGLMAALEGPEFRQIVAERFGLDLADAPTMVTLRGQSREKDGRIHTDSDAKRVTVLLYLNPRSAAWARQDGCLRLLNTPDDIENYVVEVPPVDGTLLVFPNGPTTWHGHRQFIGQRYVVQLNYMTNDIAARNELRRHKFSALVKRLTAA